MHYPLLALVPTEEITDANSAYSAVARRVAYFDMEREVDLTRSRAFVSIPRHRAPARNARERG